jgi:cytochrome b561
MVLRRSFNLIIPNCIEEKAASLFRFRGRQGLFMARGSQSKADAMAKGYDPVTKILHWLIFLAVAAQYAVGEFMPHIGRNSQDVGLVAIHIGLGGFVLLLIVVAIAWRLTHPVPQLPELPGWQRLAAAATHWALYLLILVMAILGWAAANFRGWQVADFGITLPNLANKGDSWAHTAGDIHSFLVNVLLGLVILHVVAALYHHFIVRDKVLERILPG